MLYRLFLFLVLFLFLPFIAFAQEGAATATSTDPAWLPLVTGLLALVAGSGLLSTFVKSGSWWMKIIDAIALNWGKARNDSRVQ